MVGGDRIRSLPLFHTATAPFQQIRPMICVRFFREFLREYQKLY